MNTATDEALPFISDDGRSLYFSSSRPEGFGGFDIWVSQRRSVNEPWAQPRNLGPSINGSGNELTPALSPDGFRLDFGSTRTGGFGAEDLYSARRHNRRNDFGWRPAVNLGSGVNIDASDGGPFRFEDDQTGTTTLYFNSDRPGGSGGIDIYSGALNEDRDDDVFGPAVLTRELNSPSTDRRPVIRRDGLEMILESNRPGSVGGSSDLWVTTRATTSDVWSTPVNLGPVVNSASVESRPAFSSDGTELYFNSNRTGTVGGQDLFVSTRTRIIVLVTGVTLEPSTVRVGGSFTATFSGNSLTDKTYFDIRFRTPGSTVEEISNNWQQGTSGSHSVVPGTAIGAWTITGLRSHQNPDDHRGSFVAASVVFTMSPF